MSNRTVPDLKELFKQASEIAQQVPESMQEAAFNRAIDLLTGNSEAEPITPAKATKTTKAKRKPVKQKTAEEDEDTENLLSAIDSTQHPGITSSTKVLDRSLMVLHIALRDHGIDGLMPSQIADVLTEKFRISTRSAVVSNALGLAASLVNRISNGPGFIYKIMGPGEEYLAHLGEGENSTPAPKPKKAAKQKKTAKKKTASKASTKAKSKNKSKTKIGPKAAIGSLIDSGYFSQGRTGPEIKTHLKNKRGLNFETTQLRMALLRLVREEKLDRDENADGNYEYKQS